MNYKNTICIILFFCLSQLFFAQTSSYEEQAYLNRAESGSSAEYLYAPEYNNSSLIADIQPVNTVFQAVNIPLVLICIIVFIFILSLLLYLQHRINQDLHKLHKNLKDEIPQKIDIVNNDPIKSIDSSSFILSGKNLESQEAAFRSIFNTKKINEINFSIRTLLAFYENKIKKLQEISETDPLTNLLNRRGIMKQITLEKNRVDHGYDHCYSLLLFDIDHFKLINDTEGHDMGDRVLQELADNVSRSIRKSDICGRWGGEEFLVLLPNSNRKTAELVAEKIRKSIEDMYIKSSKGRKIQVTITVGIAVANIGDVLPSLLNQADNNMYEGKLRGRNQVFPKAAD